MHKPVVSYLPNEWLNYYKIISYQVVYHKRQMFGIAKVWQICQTKNLILSIIFADILDKIHQTLCHHQIDFYASRTKLSSLTVNFCLMEAKSETAL